MTRYVYNSIECEAFVVRWEMYGEETKKRFRELMPDSMMSSDPTESRALEAAAGQFLAQLDHIFEED